MIDFSLLNKINLRCLYKSFFILVNPLSFYIYICFPSKSKVLKVRTPIGRINIWMRNRQSARTLYSIFVREHPTQFLRIDKGSKGRSPLFYEVIQNLINEEVSLRSILKKL